MPPESSSRTVPCVQCRRKHIKCNGRVPCAGCRNSSLKCVRLEKFHCRRFVASQESSLFNPDQEWLPTRHKKRKRELSIIDETIHAPNYPDNNTFLLYPEQGPQDSVALNDEPDNDRVGQHGICSSNRSTSVILNFEGSESPNPNIELQGIQDPPILKSPLLLFPELGQAATSTYSPGWRHESPGSTSVVSQNTSHPTPSSSIPVHSGLSWQSSPGIATACSPTQLNPNIRLDLSLEEACLLNCFVQVLARAFDVTDRDHQYITLLPIRAVHSPLLLSAICTASARFLTQLWSLSESTTTIKYNGVPLPGLTSQSAIHYHNKCISYLMGISVDPEHSCSDDALVAITILRFHEQMDSSLTGADNETFSVAVYAVFEASQEDQNGFLNTGIKQPPRGIDLYSASHPSLRFSACMIALRQEIYSVLIHNRPFRLPLLTSYDYPNVEELDDYDWTNRIIVWCGQVLHFCCRGGSQGRSLDVKSRATEWEKLNSFLTAWDQHQPPQFSPLFYQRQRPEKGEIFPRIWLASRCQIMALQHIELARIVLAVHDPKRQKIGLGVTAAQNAFEELLKRSTIIVCGLGMSDQDCQEGMVTASVAVSMCGEYFREPNEQAAIIDLMVILEKTHAWPTRKLVNELQKAWAT